MHLWSCAILSATLSIVSSTQGLPGCFTHVLIKPLSDLLCESRAESFMWSLNEATARVLAIVEGVFIIIIIIFFAAMQAICRTGSAWCPELSRCSGLSGLNGCDWWCVKYPLLPQSSSYKRPSNSYHRSRSVSLLVCVCAHVCVGICYPHDDRGLPLSNHGWRSFI